MSLSKPNHMPSLDFPEEILSEIFKKLPVKYVLRCLSVQKSWYHLIKSPLFVTLYLEHQKLTAHDNPKYLLFHNVNTHLFTICSDDNQCQEYCSLECPVDFDTHEWYALSNGLICVSSMSYHDDDYDPHIYIWNPLVQICKIVQVSHLSEFTELEIEWKALAFGFIPESNDYVVVHVVKVEPELPDPFYPDPLDRYDLDPNTMVIGVYSLNTGSWKILYQDGLRITCIVSDKSVFVNGNAFWVAADYDQPLIMYFNTKTEILQQIFVPDWFGLDDDQIDNPVIHPFGQSIAYFVENDESRQLDIWVLKEDMIDESSWEKKMSVSLSENVHADVLGIRNNGEPILTKSNSLISYDLDAHEPYDFVNSCDYLISNFYYENDSEPPFIITPFVETLLWLDKEFVEI